MTYRIKLSTVSLCLRCLYSVTQDELVSQKSYEPSLQKAKKRKFPDDVTPSKDQENKKD